MNRFHKIIVLNNLMLSESTLHVIIKIFHMSIHIHGKKRPRKNRCPHIRSHRTSSNFASHRYMEVMRGNYPISLIFKIWQESSMIYE